MIVYSKFLKYLTIVVLGFCSFTTAFAVEIMKWERMPLAVPLQVGQERVIFIDRNVRVGIPSSLTGKLRVQSTGGAIYLLATEAIAPTRLQLQDAETGSLILMDIVATIPEVDLSPLEPIQIIEGDPTPVRYGRTGQAGVSATQSATASATNSSTAIEVNGNATTVVNNALQRETPIPVVLTRYAAQNLYAPLRTVEPVQGVSQVNLARGLKLETILPMLPIKTRAMAAWRMDDYYVTAIQLQNTSHQRLMLDPRLLQGDFVAATFQHPDLGPAGDSTDTTVVYLITHKRNLAGSLLPVISRFNALSNIGTTSNASGGHIDEK